MAKKEEGFNFGSILKSGIFSNIISFIKDFPGKVQDFIINTEEKVIQLFYSASLMLAGLIFLSISLVFLMNEYFALSKGWSLLIIGLILIIASLIIRSRTLDDIAKRR